MPFNSLDQLDVRIIRELQEDGRRPFREISRSLDVPEATVRLRVKRLQDQGILQILAFTDPYKFEGTRLALFFVTVAPDRHDAVQAQLSEWPEVCYLSTTLGDSDLCVQILCQGDDQVWALRQRLRAIAGVTDTRVLQELKVHKLRFTMPALDEVPEEL